MPEKYRLPAKRILSVDGTQVEVTAPFGFTGVNAQELFENYAFLLATSADVSSALSTKSDLGHTHAASDVVTGTFADGRVSASSVTQHINDAGTGASDLWSADKIATEIAAGGGGGDVSSVFGRTGAVVAATSDYDASQVDFTPAGDLAATDVQAALVELDTEKAAASHTHAAGDVTSGTFADARIAESNVTQHEGAIDHGSVAGLSDDDHPQYAIPAEWSGGNTSVFTLSGSLATIPLEAEDVTTGAGFFTMDTGNDDLEVLEDGTYEVLATVTATKTTATTITQTQFVLQLDTGSGFATVARANAAIYLRVSGTQQTATLGNKIAMSAGNKVRVQGRITSGSNVDVAAQGYTMRVTRGAR